MENHPQPPSPLAALPPDPEIRPLSHLLKDMANTLSGDTVKISRISEALHERGFGIFFCLFAFPILLPIPKPPGITSALSVPIIIVAAQMAIGRHAVWLPSRLLTREISRARLTGLLDTLMPWLIRLEKFIKPRMGQITHGTFSRLTGLVSLVFSLAIFCLPLPGFGAIPALSLCLIGIGDIMRDGLAILAGWLLGFAWLGFLAFFFVFVGIEGIAMAEQWLLSFL